MAPADSAGANARNSSTAPATRWGGRRGPRGFSVLHTSLVPFVPAASRSRRKPGHQWSNAGLQGAWQRYTFSEVVARVGPS
jgi:hypothetical protein